MRDDSNVVVNVSVQRRDNSNTVADVFVQRSQSNKMEYLRILSRNSESNVWWNHTLSSGYWQGQMKFKSRIRDDQLVSEGTKITSEAGFERNKSVGRPSALEAQA